MNIVPPETFWYVASVAVRCVIHVGLASSPLSEYSNIRLEPFTVALYQRGWSVTCLVKFAVPKATLPVAAPSGSYLIICKCCQSLLVCAETRNK